MNAAPAPLLETRDLTRSFDGLRAVNRCTLQVQRGTITGLIGPNGAGKTTLFNLITGFLRPTSGAIYFKGERIDGLPPHRVFRRGIARTFQIPRPLGGMTVLENLMLVPPGQKGEVIWNVWLLPGQVARQEEELFDKAMAVLDFLDLAHLRDEYAANLSAGQKKLLELARTLMCDPELVLLDEPGAGVNPALMRRLVAAIQELCYGRGITFFIIEHDMDLVMRLCNPIIVMSSGEKIAEGTPEQIRADERVLEAYLGGQYYHQERP
ncbi:Lipopolysaccharide export system ATP-binding protein LptB [bacterium HR24]|nr:Lipopolysaccharide export system ATP-binding protein LptB [bacterium HR24]